MCPTPPSSQTTMPSPIIADYHESASSPQSDLNQLGNQLSTVYVHVDTGHVFQMQLGDEIREILGPATVKMVSNNHDLPIQLTTPTPGQLVQRIVEDNGSITHIILSSSNTSAATLSASPTLQVLSHDHNNDASVEPFSSKECQPPPPLPSTTTTNSTQNLKV
jgi:hypothetical protein